MLYYESCCSPYFCILYFILFNIVTCIATILFIVYYIYIILPPICGTHFELNTLGPLFHEPYISVCQPFIRKMI